MATCNCRTVLTTAVAVSGSNLVLTIPAGTYETALDIVLG